MDKGKCSAEWLLQSKLRYQKLAKAITAVNILTFINLVSFDWPDGKWIKANVQQSGYYRVNYDTRNWQRLSDVLKNNHKVCTYCC